MSWLLLLVPGLPLALAASLAFVTLRRAAIPLVPLAPLPALAAVLLGPPAFDAPWLMLGLSFGLAAPATTFLAFAAILWLLAGLAALAYHRDDPRRTAFLACFLLAMAGNLGLLVAEDAFGFYAFFATMSFAAYGLVVHSLSAEARRAARVYIAFVVAGELALFAGLVLAVAAAGSPLIADIRASAIGREAEILLLAGFGIKLGLVPLHFWLPLARAAAPVAASAVLSGSMIKAGLFGILAFLPPGAAGDGAIGLALVLGGLAALPLSALLGGLSERPKTVLAWSSVGQMGLIAMALGVAFIEPATWPLLAPAIVFYAAHHAFAKGALFLGVGAALADPRPGWRRAILGALLLPAASLAALPLTSGYAGKAAVKAVLADLPGLAGWLLPAVTASSFVTAILMGRLILLLARHEVQAKPRFLALPALAAVAVSSLAFPLWTGAPVLPAAIGPGLMLDILMVAGGIAVAAVIGVAGLPVLRAATTMPAPARPAAPAPAVGRTTIAARMGRRLRAGARAARRGLHGLAGAIPSARPEAAAVVAVIAVMLAIEGRNLLRDGEDARPLPLPGAVLAVPPDGGSGP
jgi:formate hydrogenlyase subunit 3/multisubunit Na+/H+ antiporter MnhD subunit